MNVANVATAVFGLLAVLGTMLELALNNKRSEIERIRTLTLAGPNSVKDHAISWAMWFSNAYLDFIFGRRSYSWRALILCVLISLVTTLLVLGGMENSMGHGISQLYAGWAVLFGIVDSLALYVIRLVVRAAFWGKWHVRPVVKLFSTLLLIAAVAYLAMGLTWCVYYIVVQFIGHHVPELSMLVLTFFFWVFALMVTHHADIMPATIPGAFDSIVLLVIFALPGLFVSTARISNPLFQKALNGLLAMPKWSGRAIAIGSAIVGVLCKLALKS